MDPLDQSTREITHPAPATPGGDVVTESDKIEGGRYRGQIPSIGPWKCPACAAENSGPIAAGCQACGSGSAQPKHVGVPPVAKPRAGSNAGRIGQGIWPGDKPEPEPVIAVEPLAGFNEWCDRRFGYNNPSVGQLKVILAEAWHAAIVWYVSQKPTVIGTEPPAEPTVDSVPIPRMLVEKLIEILEDTVELDENELGIVVAQLREALEHE